MQISTVSPYYTFWPELLVLELISAVYDPEALGLALHHQGLH